MIAVHFLSFGVRNMWMGLYFLAVFSRSICSLLTSSNRDRIASESKGFSSLLPKASMMDLASSSWS